MKKILIGTHNMGKFNEISYLISKKYKKVSPLKLKIPSPKETGKTFSSNSNLKAMRNILKRLKNKKNRSAFFICCLSLKFPKKKTFTVTGKVYGKISTKVLGKNGFGYDPIFIPKNNNKTFGQISKLKKIKIDHRYIAFKKMKKKFRIL